MAQFDYALRKRKKAFLLPLLHFSAGVNSISVLRKFPSNKVVTIKWLSFIGIMEYQCR